MAKETKNELLKDKKSINHKSELKESLKDIADIMKHFRTSGENRKLLAESLGDKETMLLGKEEQSREHIPNHNGCESCASDTMTEKRICRCMKYYGNDMELCVGACKLQKKWKNIGNIQIIDYEVPTKYVVSRVGGIDLIINDAGQHYAVEVKPPNSSETLARMFAEILTYTIKMNEELESKNIKPAICFFEKKYNKESKKMEDTESEQLKQYRELVNLGNESLQYIMRYIKVFCFKVKENPDSDVFEFEICEVGKYE